MSLNNYTEGEENDKNQEESINKYKNIFSNYENNLPSLSESLKQMFESSNLNEKQINEYTQEIIKKCKKKIDPIFDGIQKKYNNITQEDAYIICSYTHELKERKYSPYKILNKNLVEENREKGIKSVSKYLYILLKSLRKLPRYYPKVNLSRCVDIKVGKGKYGKGLEKIFWSFTSSSTEAILTFLGKEKKLNTGTIFSLGGDIWGYDITDFNNFHEKEILIEPERRFEISQNFFIFSFKSGNNRFYRSK